MTAVWEWLKKWGAVVGGVVLALFTLGWWTRRKLAELGRVKDALAVSEARAEIGALRARREIVSGQVENKDAAIAVIDQQLIDQRRKLADAHEHGAKLTDQEVADALARLGY